MTGAAEAGAVKRDLLRDLARFGGLAQRSQLYELGHAARTLSREVAAGTVRCPHRGWIASDGAPPNAVRAVELHGRLGGSSALRSYGIWVDGRDLVVATAPTASRLPPLGDGELRVWGLEKFPSPSDRRWRVSALDALCQHAQFVDRLSLIASVDSAMYNGRLSSAQLRMLVAALPRQLRKIASQVDSRSMSGTESKLRVACVEAGLRVEPQASINRVGFVDLLIDGWLIVEVDSREFHDGPVNQHNDRLRDGNAVLGSYGHLRFDYRMVQFNLSWCLGVIHARLGQGRG
jgi:hypothetical protein